MKPIEEIDPEFAGMISNILKINATHKPPAIVINDTRVFFACEKEYKEVILPTPTRNDPCFCGSNRKFKKCCGIA